jgi:hypothetical protein
MLGLKRLEADFVYGGAAAAFTAPLGGGGEGLLELGFQVEEEEMLVDLELRLTYSTPTPTPTNFTFFVDGADVETVGTAGLMLHECNAAGEAMTIYLNKTVRLDKGYHVVDVRLLNAVEAPTLAGATIPAELTARRHSHPATLGHGVDSKGQLIQ